MSTTGAVRDTDTTTWTIDPTHSGVEFGVRHMMISTVKGRFTEMEGAIRLDGEEFTDSAVEVEIDAGSIDTGEEERDAHLRSGDFLDVEEHPTIAFRSREVEGSEDDFRVRGKLTIRGVSREVVLDAEKLGGGVDPWGNERQAFRAETRISRKAFGLTWNQALETGGVLVGDELRIVLEVQAVRSEAESGG